MLKETDTVKEDLNK